jgi:ribosomal protein L23
MIITFSEVSDEQVANRRLARWTQPDPLQIRGQAPHIGGHSAANQPPGGPVPHGTGAPIRRDPGDLKGIESKIKAQQAQQAAVPMGPPAPIATADIQPQVEERHQEAARKINEEFKQATNNLLNKFGVSADVIANHERLTSLSEADIASITPMKGHGGINEADGVVLNVTLKDGSHVVYKVVPNEQKSEVVAEAIDKIFNLNVNSASVSNNNISAKFLLQKIGLRPDSRAGKILINGLARGGGHLQEFCQPDCKNMADSPHSKTQLYNNEGFRNDSHKIIMNDWLTGNWDRHYNNFMVDGNGRAVQIDTGFGGRFAWDYRHNPDAGIDYRGELMTTEGGGAAARYAHRGRKPGNMSQDELKAEIEAVFEDHFSLEKFQALKQEFNMGQANNFSTIEEFKQNFLDIAGKIWLPINESFGQANPPEGSA